MLKRDHQLVLPTQARAPGFRVELKGTTFRLVATGAWTVAEAAKVDTALAMLLQRTAAAWEKSGLRTRYAGATEGFRILIEEVRRRGGADRPEIERRKKLQFLTDDMTKALTGVWGDAVQLTAFLGEVTAALGRMIRQPWRFRPVSFIHHLD